MINISINVNKIDKTKLFEGKNGKYLNITVDTLQSPDQYGNTHTVYLSQTKEERTAKTPKVYLGNGKEFVFNSQPQGTNQGNPPKGYVQTNAPAPNYNFNPSPENVDSDLPF